MQNLSAHSEKSFFQHSSATDVGMQVELSHGQPIKRNFSFQLKLLFVKQIIKILPNSEETNSDSQPFGDWSGKGG